MKVPDGVKVEVKARKVTVSGPRGTLTREFKHIQLDIILQDPSTVRVDMWFGKRKAIACIRTICSHIENMITGVTKGYLYKMRFVYSHFPINVSLAGRTVEIRNYLGEKLVRRVKLVDGVCTAWCSKDGEIRRRNARWSLPPEKRERERERAAVR